MAKRSEVRENVLKVIDLERNYQDLKFGLQRSHSIVEWVAVIEDQLKKAKAASISARLDSHLETRKEFVKIAAICVAALENSSNQCGFDSMIDEEHAMAIYANIFAEIHPKKVLNFGGSIRGIKHHQHHMMMNKISPVDLGKVIPGTGVMMSVIGGGGGGGSGYIKPNLAGGKAARLSKMKFTVGKKKKK